MTSKIIQNYQINEILGSGQYGNVYKAFDMRNNSFVAIKIVPSDKFKSEAKLEEFTMNEIQALSKINCKNIVKFIEIIITKNNYYFVYEFCNGGTLESLMTKHGLFNEEDALCFMKQIINAYQVLVRENIMHRDLKPANILIHNDELKLADFGFCKQLDDSKELSKTMVGSPIYMAPEVLLGKEYQSKAEIWSLGCVLYELLFGTCPFEANSIADLIQTCKNNPVIFKLDKNQISQQTQSLLLQMLVKDQDQRISWENLFSHPLLNVNVKAQQQALIKQPLDIQQMASIKNLKFNRTFKLIISERDKLTFLYRVMQRIVELDCIEELPLIVFSFFKKIHFIAERIKDNLISPNNNINVSVFPSLSSLDQENWGAIRDSLEFKAFATLMLREVELINAQYTELQKEAVAFSQAGLQQQQTDPVNCFDSDDQFSSTRFNFIFLKYLDGIKNLHLSKCLSPIKTNANKWLLHINEICDVMELDQFFQNFIDINVPFAEQNYFQMMENYSTDNIYIIANNKLDLRKQKFEELQQARKHQQQ